MGAEPKGIVGSGEVTRSTYSDGVDENLIRVKFDILLDYNNERILEAETLFDEIPEMKWYAQASGTIMKNDIPTRLQYLWNRYWKNEPIGFNNHIFKEGTVKTVILNVHERSPQTRKLCIDEHGYNCKICSFNFEKTYGVKGKDYIHVHHIKSLSKIGKKHTVVPINDLIPVCPNCHAMLHLGSKPLKPKELIEIIEKRKN